jgi:hypothetical protein
MKKMKYIATFEAFDKVAFHGYLMDPEDMRLPDCSVEWHSPDQDTGCPGFSDSPNITNQDMNKAITYLKEEDIKELIAYSRGGAIFIQSLASGAPAPEYTYLVAPAWNRKWATMNLNGSEAKGINGCVIHGGLDDKVPLVHSVILARNSDLPLYIFPDKGHVDILKYKDNPTAGKKVKDLDKLISVLPDWGIRDPQPEEIALQKKIADSL